MKPYYSLLERDNGTGNWHVQFGDYDKRCMQAELQDCRDQGIPRKDLRIIKTDHAQAAIELAVANFNKRN